MPRSSHPVRSLRHRLLAFSSPPVKKHFDVDYGLWCVSELLQRVEFPWLPPDYDMSKDPREHFYSHNSILPPPLFACTYLRCVEVMH